MDEGRDLRSVEPSISELIQALKARAGFETMFPEGERRKTLIEFVSRLHGDYPDAYDIIGTAAYLEGRRVLMEKSLAVFNGATDGNPAAFKYDWEAVLKDPLLRGLENLTVSMRGGKGRREGVEISKTQPLAEDRRRWSWRRD